MFFQINVAWRSWLYDKLTNGVTILNPGYDSDLQTDGSDRVSFDGVILSFRRVVEHFVNERKKLHNSFIKSKILFSFEEEIVIFLIRTFDDYFLRTLFGKYNFKLILKARDVNGFCRRIVFSKKTYFGVFHVKEIGWHFLQINFVDSF